jgi:uncharacterized membrane protein YbhN (UPF0104 family)
VLDPVADLGVAGLGVTDLGVTKLGATKLGVAKLGVTNLGVTNPGATDLDIAQPPPGQVGLAARVRTLLALAVGVAVAVLAWTHRGTVAAGGATLARADSEWLVLAAVMTVGIWVSSTMTQLGCLPIRPPLRRLLAVQLAANFANHLSPAGSGGIGVTLRFLRRNGVSWTAACGATGLNTLAGVVTHVVLLAAALLTAPGLAYRIQPDVPSPGPATWLGSGVAVALLVAGVAVLRVRVASWASTAWSGAVVELRAFGEVLRDPGRAAALWLGSFATPVLHALVLYAVLHSIGLGTDLGTALVVYLVVSTLSALLPSPGGLGALDVALLAALVALGITSPVALGAVLGYRLLTVWVPLLPGALALAVLVRRRVL